MVPITRSQWAFAIELRTGVFRTFRPNPFTAMPLRQKTRSRDRGLSIDGRIRRPGIAGTAGVSSQRSDER